MNKKNANVIIDLDNILEKTASLKPMTDNQLEAIAYTLNKKAMNEEKAFFEKMASVEENDLPTRQELKNIHKKADFKFSNLSQMAHGDFIVFPEINNNDMCLTPAIVLKDFEKLPGLKRQENPKSMIVTNDGRYKIFKDSENFLCTKAPGKAFKINMVPIREVYDKRGARVVALNGDKVISPFVVDYTEQISVFDENRTNQLTFGKMISVTSLFQSKDKKNKFGMGYESEKIYPLDNASFTPMTKNEYILRRVQQEAIPEHILRAIIYGQDDAKFLTCDEEKKVILLSDEISTDIKTQEEFDLKTNLIETGHEVEKVAFAINTITLECVDRRMGLFNLTIEYRDTDERFMNLRRQNFMRTKEGKIRAILRIMKYDASKIAEIIYKAKNEPRAVYPIPKTCTIEDIKKLKFGELTNVSKEGVKNMVKKFVDPSNMAKALATATVSGIIMKSTEEAAKNGLVGDNIQRAVKLYKKIANDSSFLSAEFEKLAQDREDEYMLDVAKVMAISKNFSEKIATVLTDDNNVYPDLKTVAKEISYTRPILEKMAFDLTKIKVNQALSRNEIMNPHHIAGAIEVMDTMYKTASCLNREIDKDNLVFKGEM